jgi:hypothetical protein
MLFTATWKQKQAEVDGSAQVASYRRDDTASTIKIAVKTRYDIGRGAG